MVEIRAVISEEANTVLKRFKAVHDHKDVHKALNALLLTPEVITISKNSNGGNKQ